MDAGIPPGIYQRQEFASSDSDEIPLVTLNPSGELQIIGNDPVTPLPAAPYVITSDDNQPIYTQSTVLVTTAPVTQLSPSVYTYAPVILSSIPSSLSESGFASGSPAPTTITLGMTSAALQSTRVTTTAYTDRPSSESMMPLSSGPTVTFFRTSELVQSSARTASSHVISALSSSSVIVSTISSSLSSSFTDLSYSSFQTVVVSTSSALLPFSRSSAFSSSSSSISSAANSSTVMPSSSTEQPASTIFPSVFPGTASNLDLHSPPYYIGIIFGIVAGIALLAALIAWWIRLRSHARRRRATRSLVPWARLGNDDDGGLEAGRRAIRVDDAVIGAMNLGSREDLAHVQAWTPRGDRDVGEPRRSDSYFTSSAYSLHNHAIPGHNLLPDESLGRFTSLGGYHPSSLRPSTQRQLPSHLIDQDAAARAMQEDVSRRPTCHLNVANPGPADYAPWNQRSSGSAPRSMVERLRNLGKPPTEPIWENFEPLPSPGGSQVRDAATIEAWTLSFRSSLVNAFNAVASNISGAPRMGENDKLSAPPTRAARKSIRETFGGEKAIEMKSRLARDDSISTLSSTAWTLEETGDGAGVVHFAEKKMSQRPLLPSPALSFGDGEKISTYDDLTSDVHRIRTQESQIPLIASSMPQPAHIRPESYFTRRISSETIHHNSPSRNTSLYSAASMSRDVAEFPRNPPGLGIPGLLSMKSSKRDDIGDEDSVVIHPDSISRLASTDSSVVPSAADRDPEFASTMDAAARALINRQKRVQADN